MPRKVTFQVDADTKAAQKALKDAAQATDKLHSALDRFGPVGSAVATMLGKLGFSSVKAATNILAGAAAIGAVSAVIEKSIGMYVALADKVRHYAAVTGESAEQASRQVQAFDEMGVSADVAAAGLFKLAKAVNTNQAGLHALGIEVARNQDGTVDLNGTLINAIKAYQETGDAARRDAIILTAFGKAGAAMIPILELDVAQLKRLQDQVGKVYTQKDLDAVRNYQIGQKQLEHSWNDLGLTIGQTFLPVAAAATEKANEDIYVQKKLAEQYGAVSWQANEVAVATGLVGQQYRDEFRAAQTAKGGLDALAEAHRREADQALADAAAEQTLLDTLHKSQDANFAYRQSIIDLHKAQKDAADAKGKDAEANLRLEEAYFKVSDAAVELAREQAALNHQYFGAKEAADVQIASLLALEKGLNHQSPLYKAIEAYIALLRKVPAEVTTLVTASSGTGSQKTGVHAGGHGQQVMDDGGTVQGPEGALVPVLARGGEEFSGYPPKHGGPTFNFTINATMADGPSLDRWFREALARARMAPGT